MDMYLEILTSVLGWCAVINTLFLILWFVLLMNRETGVINFHQRFFNLSSSDIVKSHYLLMGFYKLMNAMFFMVPWLVLKIIN